MQLVCGTCKCACESGLEQAVEVLSAGWVCLGGSHSSVPPVTSTCTAHWAATHVHGCVGVYVWWASVNVYVCVHVSGYGCVYVYFGQV